MNWTAERIETLKAMWADGMTVTLIAGRFGVDRGAISGKLDRLGLLGGRTLAARQKRLRSIEPEQRPKLRQKACEQASSSKLTEECPAGAADEPAMISGVVEAFLALEPQHCRWPYGEPREAGFRFCGQRKLSGLPYCEAHQKMAIPKWKPEAVATAVSITRRGGKKS